MEESDRCGGSHFVACRGGGCSYCYLVRVTGETVRPPRDHPIGIDLDEQFRRELDQDLAVDFGEPAIWKLETSRLDEPELGSGRIKFPLPNCCQGRPGRRARVPDLAGSALGKRDHTDLSAGTRVLGE